MRAAAKSVLLLLPAFLMACAQTVDTRINSSGAVDATPARYSIAMPHAAPPPEYEAAHRLVTAKLAARGYNASLDGTAYLQIGIASRPANLTLKQPGTILGAASTKPSNKQCPLSEYRLSIALNNIADGREIYTASAAEFHCAKDFAAALPVLVDAALADLGQPKGAYVFKRKLPARKLFGGQVR